MRIRLFGSGIRVWEFGSEKWGVAVWDGNARRAIWVGHIQGSDAALHAVRPKRLT